MPCATVGESGPDRGSRGCLFLNGPRRDGARCEESGATSPWGVMITKFRVSSAGSLGRERGYVVGEDSPEINAQWARGILQGMPVLMDAFDADGSIVMWNAECERVTGYSAAEIIGNPRALEKLYPDVEYRTFMMEEARRRHNDDYSSVWQLTAKDGTRKTVEWFNVGSRLKVPGWLEWSIGIDITERKRLEAALQEAGGREQRRIASELHDGLGQELSGLSLLAAGLAAEHAHNHAKLAHDLRQLAELASRSVTTCRTLAHGLSPLREHQNSLVDALRQLASDTTGLAGGPTVTFTEASSARSVVSHEFNNHLYRIAQEALNNSLKHSEARSIQIRLYIDRNKVCLQISDDGCGIGALPGFSNGIGMQTMRDRAAAIGGRLTISINEPKGTLIQCECFNR
jgi:PAS domain S-box-containing protein